MKPKFTIAELKTMDANRGKRIAELKAELKKADQERQHIRTEMEGATTAFDSAAYNAAADKDELLSKKIGRIIENIKALEASEHAFSDADVKNAWAADMKGYNAEMSKMLFEYRSAKRALFESYVALARKQDRMLKRMLECDALLNEKPLHYCNSPLRESVQSFIPAFDNAADQFFRDVRQPGDPERGRLMQTGNGAFSDVDTVSTNKSAAALVEAYMFGY